MINSQVNFILFYVSLHTSLQTGAWSFVIPLRRANEVSTSSCSSGLRLFTTESYLDCLSTSTIVPQGPSNFVTSDYLNALSQIVQSSTDYTTDSSMDMFLQVDMNMDHIYDRQTSAEEFLHQLSSQLAQLTIDTTWTDGNTASTVLTTAATMSTTTTSSVFLSSSTLEPLESIKLNTELVYAPITDTLVSSIPISSPLDGMYESNMHLSDAPSSTWDQLGQMAVAAASGEEDYNVATSTQLKSEVNIDEAIASLEKRREMIQKQLSQLSSSTDSSVVDASRISSSTSSSNVVVPEIASETPSMLNNVDESSASQVSKSLKAMLSEQSYSSPSTSFSFDKSTDAGSDGISDSFKSWMKTPSFKPPSSTSYNFDPLDKPEKIFSSMKEIGTKNPFNSNSNMWTPKSPTESNPVNSFNSDSLKELLSSVSHKITDAGETSIKAINEALQERQMALNEGASGSLKTISEATAGTVKTIGDASLADVASSVISGIKLIATLLLKLIDAILVNVGEPTAAQLLSNVQISITTVVNGATTAVTQTITDIGNLSVKDILQGLISLLVLVSKLLLIVLNMLVKYLSGKGASEWVLEATTRLNNQAKILADQTSHAVYDVTHASFTELISSIGAFSQEVANHIVSTMDLASDSIVTSGIM